MGYLGDAEKKCPFPLALALPFFFFILLATCLPSTSLSPSSLSSETSNWFRILSILVVSRGIRVYWRLSKG